MIYNDKYNVKLLCDWCTFCMHNLAVITLYFRKLGFDRELTTIYLALHTHGPQTISELSRSSGVERTRLYRTIDRLAASGLIETETHYKRHIFKAAPIANIHLLK